jgi:hypothetical protein
MKKNSYFREEKTKGTVLIAIVFIAVIAILIFTRNT